MGASSVVGWPLLPRPAVTGQEYTVYPSIVSALLSTDDTPIETRRVAGKGLTVGEYATTSTLEHARAHPEDAAALACAASLLSGRIVRGAERWRRAAAELAASSGADLRADYELSWVERAQRSASRLIGSGLDRRLPGHEPDHPASMAACLAADAVQLEGRERAAALYAAACLLIGHWRAARDVPGAHVDAWIAMRQAARDLGFSVPDAWSYYSHPFLSPAALDWSAP